MAQQINLYNPAFEEHRTLLSVRGASLGWVGVGVLVAAGAVYAHMSLWSAEKQEREMAAQVTAAKSEMQRLAGQVSGRRRNPEITAQIARLESEIKGREEIMGVLEAGGLGDTRGFSEHLKAFARQSFEGVWLTGLRIAAGGRDVAIEGRALQAAHVPGYLKRLNGESAMHGHPFSELVIQLPKEEPGSKSPAEQEFVEFRLSTKTDAGTAPKTGAQ